MSHDDLKLIVDEFRHLTGLTNNQLIPALGSRTPNLSQLFRGYSPITKEKIERLIPVLESHLGGFLDSRPDWPESLRDEVEEYLGSLIEELEDATK